LIFECFFENIYRKFEFYYNRWRKKCTLLEITRLFWWYLAQFFLEWEMFQTKCVEKLKTLILGSITFF
jgi:hypothetical protein